MSYAPDPRYQQPYSGAADDTVQSANMHGAYAQNQRESYVDPAGNRVEQQMEVFEDRNQQRANIRYWISAVTYFILAVLEILFALRLLFRLLGANESNSFIMFLYNLTHVFVAPFNGIFNDQTVGNSTFELSTLIAMIVYALIAWGIVSLGRLLFAPVVDGHQRISTTRRSHM